MISLLDESRLSKVPAIISAVAVSAGGNCVANSYS